MTNPDLLILVVGVFITFMAVWASVAYGVLVVQRWELNSAQSGPDADSRTEGSDKASADPGASEGNQGR
jgi:hypothetical protein